MNAMFDRNLIKTNLNKITFRQEKVNGKKSSKNIEWENRIKQPYNQLEINS